MTNVKFNFDEAWDLVYILKSIVAQSEYKESIDLYCLRDDAIISHNKKEWERLESTINKLEKAYSINIHVK